MTRDILEVIAGCDRKSPPVVRCETDQVWVSGMNSRPWYRARRIKQALEAAGYDVGEPHVDAADLNNGIVIPVGGCTELAGTVYEEVTGR